MDKPKAKMRGKREKKFGISPTAGSNEYKYFTLMTFGMKIISKIELFLFISRGGLDTACTQAE